MRIIGGQYGGRKIQLPKTFSARPTTDYAKESLFNILTNYIDFESIKVLDLFAGTGSISYEFVSRGCNDVTLVESNSKNAAVVKKLVENFGMTQIKVINTDAIRFIKNLPGKYDIIFADPPYEMPGINEIPDLILTANILNPNGWLIMEHSSNHSFINHPNFLQNRVYGSVNFSFFANVSKIPNP